MQARDFSPQSAHRAASPAHRASPPRECTLSPWETDSEATESSADPAGGYGGAHPRETTAGNGGAPFREATAGYGRASSRETTALSRIRLRHLTCFVVVAQERTLARAAGRLHLSQPAVSKTLAELEDLAGRRLVDRGRAGAQLTQAGEQ